MKEPSPTSSEEVRAIKTPKTLKMESVGQLYNEAAEYKTFGYRKEYMLRKWEQFFNGKYFDCNNYCATSKPIDCTPFSHFIFYLDCEASLNGTPDLYVEVQFSPDNNQWYELQDGPFGTMIIPAAATQLKECYAGTVLGRYMRVWLYSNLAGTQKLWWNVSCSAELLQP